MMPPPPNPLLDFPPGQVTTASTFEFVAEDASGPKVVLHPLQPPSIRADTTASIHRTLSGFVLPAHERAQVDPLSDRVRVTMRLADGTRWPCGVFVWATGSGTIASTNAQHSSTLYDLGLLIDQPLIISYGLPPDSLITPAMAWLLTDAGLDDVDVTPSDQRCGGPLNWPAGTARRAVLDDLATLASYTPAYFDAAGTARAHRYPALEVGAGHQYLPGARSRVLGGDIEETLITAPGAHLVIGQGVTIGEVTGYAEVPYTSPLNPRRRRQTRVEVHRVQGIADTAHAQSMAEGFAQRQPADYRVCTIETPIDPRHDLFETVDYAAASNVVEAWREQGFQYQCSGTGRQTHRLAKGTA